MRKLNKNKLNKLVIPILILWVESWRLNETKWKEINSDNNI